MPEPAPDVPLLTITLPAMRAVDERLTRMPCRPLVQNSGVNLSSATTGHFLDVVNSTVSPNVGVGIRGQIGAYAVGGLGTLTGTGGAKNFTDASSIDRTTP